MPLLYLAKYSPIFDSTSQKIHYLPSVIAVMLSLALGAISYERIENRFRKPNLLSRVKVNFFVTIFLFFLPTFILFLSIDQGSINRYWGLDRTVERPTYAGDIDKNCIRQNDKSRSEPCIYGSNTSENIILLVGDSHATHISEAVIETGRKFDMKVVVWTHGHCPIQFTSQIKNALNPSCVRENLRMLQWVRINKPSITIVSQYVRRDSEQQQLRDGLDQLKMYSVNLLLVLNTPVFPDRDDFMVSRPLVMKPYNPPKEFAIQRMEKVDMFASASLGEWARETGIATLDLWPLFCNQLRCSRYGNGEWLYWDDDHLSVFGAALAEPKLRNYFLSLSKVVEIEQK
jgi:hypothetical protein